MCNFIYYFFRSKINISILNFNHPNQLDIRQDLKTIKSEVELKTGTILSKSQSILNKVKSTSDLVSKINDGTSAYINNSKQTASKQAKQTDQKDQNKIIQGQKGANKAPECIQTPMANDAIITISDDDHDQSSPIPKVTPTCSQSSSLKDKATTINDDDCIQHFSSPKQPIKNLTFLTGSCILKSIETRFLAENVRIRTSVKLKLTHWRRNYQCWIFLDMTKSSCISVAMTSMPK